MRMGSPDDHLQSQLESQRMLLLQGRGKQLSVDASLQVGFDNSNIKKSSIFYSGLNKHPTLWFS